MKYLILSDIHSNLDALDSVLNHATKRGFDKVVILGDLVGYCANPNEVIDTVRNFPEIAIVRGNHDKVVSGIDSGREFNELAITSCTWTREHVNAENMKYLEKLAAGPQNVDGLFDIAHGTPIDEDAYILSEHDAAGIFAHYPSRICFFGHSHIPLVFSLKPEAGITYFCPSNEEEEFVLEKEARFLINVGSVGQPRDRDPRAAYGCYDTDNSTVFFYRVQYPVAEAQKKIRDANLPFFLAERLLWGA